VIKVTARSLIYVAILSRNTKGIVDFLAGQPRT
jgi:hypothetical protein